MIGLEFFSDLTYVIVVIRDFLYAVRSLVSHKQIVAVLW